MAADVGEAEGDRASRRARTRGSARSPAILRGRKTDSFFVLRVLDHQHHLRRRRRPGIRVQTPIAREGRVELVVDDRRVHAAGAAPSPRSRRTIDTRLGTSCVANTTSSPFPMKTGASLRRAVGRQSDRLVPASPREPGRRATRRAQSAPRSVGGRVLRDQNSSWMTRPSCSTRSSARAAELMPASSRIVVPTMAGVIGSVTGCSPRASLSPMIRPGCTPAPAQIEK